MEERNMTDEERQKRTEAMLYSVQAGLTAVESRLWTEIAYTRDLMSTTVTALNLLHGVEDDSDDDPTPTDNNK
jgi:hypothetical protein